MGTLNLCLGMPDAKQKTKIQSDLLELRKRPKTAENLPKSKLEIFQLFLMFSQPRMIGFNSGLFFVYGILRDK